MNFFVYVSEPTLYMSDMNFLFWIGVWVDGSIADNVWIAILILYYKTTLDNGILQKYFFVWCIIRAISVVSSNPTIKFCIPKITCL